MLTHAIIPMSHLKTMIHTSQTTEKPVVFWVFFFFKLKVKQFFHTGSSILVNKSKKGSINVSFLR